MNILSKSLWCQKQGFALTLWYHQYFVKIIMMPKTRLCWRKIRSTGPPFGISRSMNGFCKRSTRKQLANDYVFTFHKRIAMICWKCPCETSNLRSIKSWPRWTQVNINFMMSSLALNQSFAPQPTTGTNQSMPIPQPRSLKSKTAPTMVGGPKHFKRTNELGA